MTRQASVLLTVLMISFLLSLMVITGFYLISGSFRTELNIGKADQAYLMARSGVEDALVRIKNKLCDEDCVFNKDISSDMGYQVEVSKDGEIYIIKSTGRYEDAEKTIEVVAKKGEKDWIPFYLPAGELTINSASWNDAKIFMRDLIVNGKEGDEAKKELRSLGFEVLNYGNKPSFNEIVHPTEIAVEAPVSTGTLEVVSCDGSAVASFDGSSILLSGKCKLGNTPVTKVDLIRHPKLKLVSTNELSVENMNKIEWWRFSNLDKDITLAFEGSKKVIFNGFKLENRGHPKGKLKIFVTSDKDIKVNGDVDIALNEVSFVQFLANGNLDIDGNVRVHGASFKNNLDLRFYSLKNLSIDGDVSFEGFNVDKGFRFISSAGENQQIDGGVDFKSFSSKGDLNTTISAGKKIEIDKNVNFHSLSSQKNLEVNLLAGEDIELSSLNLNSFSARGSINVNLIAKKNLTLDSLNLRSFSLAQDASINLESGEDLSIPGGVGIAGMSLGKDVSLSLISLGKSIKSQDLIKVLSGSFSSDLNVFLLAAKDIDAKNLEEIYSASFRSNINTLVWGEENIKGDLSALSFSINGLLNYALITDKQIDTNIELPSWPWFDGKPSGLSKQELEDICENGSGKVKEIACNIINSLSNGDNSNKLEILSYREIH